MPVRHRARTTAPAQQEHLAHIIKGMISAAREGAAAERRGDFEAEAGAVGKLERLARAADAYAPQREELT